MPNPDSMSNKDNVVGKTPEQRKLIYILNRNNGLNNTEISKKRILPKGT